MIENVEPREPTTFWPAATGTMSRRAILGGLGTLGAVAFASAVIPAYAVDRKGQSLMTQKVIRTDGVELATEAFGDPTHEPTLLIMGAMASMLWWPEEFCRLLANHGRYVIRYDNRDTGLSTTYPPAGPTYSKEDMAADVIRVLDSYGLASAHLVGMSLGGEIAQIAAFAYPDRVRTLTLISTSPVGVDTSDLPQTSDAYMQHAAAAEHVDWTDNAQVIDFIVKDMKMIAGTAHVHDEAGARAFVERDVKRARSFVSVTNHFMLQGSDTWSGRLSSLAAPILVIHGTDDPIFPIEHGERLAETAKSARLMRLEGGGHEIHRAEWDRIVGAIDKHTAP